MVETKVGLAPVEVLILNHADGGDVHHVHLGGVAPQTLVVCDALLLGGRQSSNIATTRCENVTLHFSCLLRVVNI